jgi:hypothetical protein
MTCNSSAYFLKIIMKTERVEERLKLRRIWNPEERFTVISFNKSKDSSHMRSMN